MDELIKRIKSAEEAGQIGFSLYKELMAIARELQVVIN